ncbi:hypothetical protein Lal_00007570 [Lupinus albus]|nr:hypothetical protein Lal_00007570 [Lupinus albus]
MELMDLPLIGRNFTWYQYGTMSRLEDFSFHLGDSSQWALNRDFSDHCLIILRQRKMEKGLTPFRFNNCWLKHHNFADLVSNSWCEDSCSGRKAFIVKEKLKALKGKIKVWNKVSFGCLDSKLGQLSQAIQELDLIGENSTLNSKQLCSLKKLTDSLLRQKSRCKWLKEGDANTSHFHACINNRRRRNQIRGIWINDMWYEEDSALKREVSNYFKNLFTAGTLVKPKLFGVDFPTLNDNQWFSLDAEFLERRFLWENKRGGKGIAWVAWDMVCKPKELGGLGVKDLLHFNHALLGKWRWRRLQDNEAFWVQVIDSKYGSEWSFQMSGIASRWCKDIGKVGSPDADTSGWFDGNVWKEIGNGLQTLF